MTRPDLSRLHILNRELEVDQERLASLKDAAQRVTPQLTGVPGGGGDGEQPQGGQPHRPHQGAARGANTGG